MSWQHGESCGIALMEMVTAAFLKLRQLSGSIMTRFHVNVVEEAEMFLQDGFFHGELADTIVLALH